jgi:hypothetical protein
MMKDPCMLRLFSSLTLGAALIALAACGGGDPRLMNIRNTESGPDEFSILPTAPIVIPENRSDLPQPTPGGANRTDPDPLGDAIRALGGNPDRGVQQAGGLTAYAGRFGVSSDIRDVLAREDLAFRSQNSGRLLERVFNTNVYFRAYDSVSLDRYAELERLRRAGVRTPAAPPQDIARP